MNYIAGLSPSAEEYMAENSNFSSYNDTSVKKIGCGKSDGIINTIASMYKKVELNEGFIVPLFKYTLKNNQIAHEVIQKNLNNIVFVRLEIDNGKIIEWTDEEISDFIKNKERK